MKIKHEELEILIDCIDRRIEQLYFNSQSNESIKGAVNELKEIRQKLEEAI